MNTAALHSAELPPISTQAPAPAATREPQRVAGDDLTAGRPGGYDPSIKQKAAAKLSRIPIKVVPGEVLKKPDWIRVRAGSPSTRFYEIKDILRANKLVTVCEEASCPNIGECFGKGTATFMIMGDKCTRRCPFCDVGHGRPDPLDVDEPLNLAKTIAALKLRYVVITSVDRDDLRDGGAGHFGTLTLDEVFDDYFTPLQVPVYRGAQFGHIKRKFTLPVGLEVEMDATAGTIRYLQPAVL